MGWCCRRHVYRDERFFKMLLTVSLLLAPSLQLTSSGVRVFFGGNHAGERQPIFHGTIAYIRAQSAHILHVLTEARA
jgi:hypothetical protein